jgi:Zn-dependent peptidase ImmA (M78 family)
MEEQANRFSGAFMLPSATFPAEVYSPSLQSLLHLKPRWKMSVAAMVYRLRDLEIIGKDRFDSLYVGISRAGWRHREPLDDTLAPEEPQLLRRSLDILLDKGVVTRESLVLRTHLSATDIEKLLGVPTGYLNEPPQPIPLISWRIG